MNSIEICLSDHVIFVDIIEFGIVGDAYGTRWSTIKCILKINQIIRGSGTAQNNKNISKFE